MKLTDKQIAALLWASHHHMGEDLESKVIYTYEDIVKIFKLLGVDIAAWIDKLTVKEIQTADKLLNPPPDSFSR